MAHLSLSLFGACEASCDGAPLTGFRSQKVRALLAYLAVHAERAHGRETLAAFLWPEQGEEAARTYLRQALVNLRTILDEKSPDVPFLLITRDTVQLNPACSYDLDVATFRTLLATCVQHSHRRLIGCTACARRMEQVVALYRGGFLDQFYLRESPTFEEWVAVTREALHQEAVATLAKLALYHERHGSYEAVVRLARRQLVLDPWREEAHQQLMRALAMSGQRTTALAQYENCRGILLHDLGVEPDTETTALYECIRDRASSDLGVPNPAPSAAHSAAHHIDRRTHHLQNFPAQTTVLIGRERELDELCALLENPACRLITLVGQGGIGKTRLGLAAAAEQAGGFADGAAFVPLAGINATEFVAPAILAALNVALQGQRDPHDQLVDYLCGKELLLVLDNVEQLLALEQAAPDAPTSLANRLADLQERAAGLTLLVTSRERLGLPSEWLFDVAGLSYPVGEQATDLGGYSAAALFVQRARQVRQPFTLGSDEERAVAHICQLVEGLPLAIELAAAAVRTRSCTAIAAAVESNLSVLATRLHGVPERQRSMWATFEYSWRLLSDEEQRVLAGLSVFRGGFEEEAAAHIAHASPELLASLVDKSLVRWDGMLRYDLHELVRQYASAKLEAEGEGERLLRKHAEYYIALAETAAPQLFGASQVAMLDRLTREHDNFRAVFSWCQTGSGRCEFGLRLGGALENYWRFRGRIREGHSWIMGLLAQEADEAAAEPRLMTTRAALRVRAKALRVAGDQNEGMGDLAQARTFLAESVRLFRGLEDPLSLALSLWSFAHLEWTQGASARASELAEESLRLFRRQTISLVSPGPSGF